MKQPKTVKLIEKIFPSVKDDLRSFSNSAKRAPWFNNPYYTPEEIAKKADPKQLLEIKTKVKNLVDKIKKIVPSEYEVSIHNAFYHFDPQAVARNLSGGPGYVHVELQSDDEGRYCFSYSGYVWHKIELIGRILKSGEMKSGRMSYGGFFLSDDTINRIRKEREEAKAKKKSNN